MSVGWNCGTIRLTYSKSSTYAASVLLAIVALNIGIPWKSTKKLHRNCPLEKIIEKGGHIHTCDPRLHWYRISESYEVFQTSFAQYHQQRSAKDNTPTWRIWYMYYETVLDDYTVPHAPGCKLDYFGSTTYNAASTHELFHFIINEN